MNETAIRALAERIYSAMCAAYDGERLHMWHDAFAAEAIRAARSFAARWGADGGSIRPGNFAAEEGKSDGRRDQSGAQDGAA